MSKVKIQGNASGTGVLTVEAPNTNTDRTITLPDSTGTVLDSTSTLDATKLSGALPAIDGSSLTNLPASGATDINGLSDGTTSGTNCVGLGSGAVDSMTSGNECVGVGVNALTANTTGYDNTAVGHYSATSNTSGVQNVAVGSYALNNTASKSANTAVGFSAMSVAQTGGSGQHTAVGAYAMQNQTSGNWSCAFGYNALRNDTQGWSNDAFGHNALGSVNGNGASSNAAFGYGSGNQITTGHSNTCIGSNAGDLITTGYVNTCLGKTSDPSASSSLYQFTLGDSQISNLRCNDTSISSLSDERDKTNIADLPDTAGLELINKLRPVTFNWDRREWYEDGITDGSKVKPNFRRWKANSGLKQGFIAQEVQQAIVGEKCLEDSQVITDDNPDRLEFAPQHLLTNAIKAIQQLSAKVEELESEIATLKGA